jgi:hypothetical protein
MNPVRIFRGEATPDAFEQPEDGRRPIEFLAVIKNWAGDL